MVLSARSWKPKQKNYEVKSPFGHEVKLKGDPVVAKRIERFFSGSPGKERQKPKRHQLRQTPHTLRMQTL